MLNACSARPTRRGAVSGANSLLRAAVRAHTPTLTARSSKVCPLRRARTCKISLAPRRRALRIVALLFALAAQRLRPGRRPGRLGRRQRRPPHTQHVAVGGYCSAARRARGRGQHVFRTECLRRPPCSSLRSPPPLRSPRPTGRPRHWVPWQPPTAPATGCAAARRGVRSRTPQGLVARAPKSGS